MTAQIDIVGYFTDMNFLASVGRFLVVLAVISALGVAAYFYYMNRRYNIDVFLWVRKKGTHIMDRDKGRIIYDDKGNALSFELKDSKLSCPVFSQYFYPSAASINDTITLERIGNVLRPIEVPLDDVSVSDKKSKIEANIVKFAHNADMLHAWYQLDMEKGDKLYVEDPNQMFRQQALIFGGTVVGCLVLLVLASKFSGDMVTQSLDNFKDVVGQLKPISDAILAAYKSGQGVQVVP